MAVTISAVAPPSLHGPSCLSRASAAAAAAAVSPRPSPPLLAGGDDARTAPFPQGRFLALMRGQCELLSFSDDDFPPPLPLSRKGRLLPAHMFCSKQQLHTPPPVSEDDADVLAPMFSEEEIQALRAARQAPPPRPAGPRSAGEKRRRSPASPPSWPSCMSDDESEASSPPPVVKRARTRVRSRRRDAARLRKWHGKIAARMLRRQFRPPELSRGRTALGCQCQELALAGGAGAGACGETCCALHQDGREPEDRPWMYSAQGRLPLVGGPGEVLVPKLAAGNTKATVLQYARWRRGVRMPTRFYLERDAQQQQGMAAAAAVWRPADDWMMTD